MNLEKVYREVLSNLEVEDKLYWKNQKRPFVIKARNSRYIIVTRSLFGKVEYTIIDTEELVCAPNNFVFNIYDYMVQKDIDESLIDLQNGKYELSRRQIANVMKCLTGFKKKNEKSIIEFTQEGATVLGSSREVRCES